MIHFIVLTLFKDMFDGFLSSSIIKRAIENKKLDVEIIDIRDFSKDKNKKVDDTPYGGGAGMVLMCEPLAGAIDYAIKKVSTSKYEVIYMSPKGKLLSYNLAYNLSNQYEEKTYIIICGHYEGIDERIIEEYNVKEMSIGDYVLTGGELPAMVLIDSVSRLVPGVITDDSLKDESHTKKLLEYPQYTKPYEWRNRKVPDILLSGHHEKIDEYRKEESLKITMKNRPDLLKEDKN